MAAIVAGCGGSSSRGAGAQVIHARALSGYGSALMTSAGRSVYVRDPAATSTCADAGSRKLVPLIVSGDVWTGKGVDRSKLTTVRRKDGTRQAVYDKHLLYTCSLRVAD